MSSIGSVTLPKLDEQQRQKSTNLGAISSAYEICRWGKLMTIFHGCNRKIFVRQLTITCSYSNFITVKLSGPGKLRIEHCCGHVRLLQTLLSWFVHHSKHYKCESKARRSPHNFKNLFLADTTFLILPTFFQNEIYCFLVFSELQVSLIHREIVHFVLLRVSIFLKTKLRGNTEIREKTK